MIKIGIDLSLNHTGICLMKNSKDIVFKTIIPNKSLSQEDKMIYTSNEINTILYQYSKRHNKLLINIERPFFMGRYSNNISTLNGIFYVVICNIKTYTYFNNKDITFNYISPNTVKVTATGNGRSSKEEMYKNLPPKIKQIIEHTNDKHNDLSDAYWIMMTNINNKTTSRRKNNVNNKKRTGK